MKELEENLKKRSMINHKIYSLTVVLFFMLLTTSCQLLSNKAEDKIELPTELSQEQLQNMRYTFKRDKAYKQKFLYQEKTDAAIVTIYNVINYQIKDNQSINIGEGFEYLIFDISIDNPTSQPFNIDDFTKSCRLSNADSNYLYSNIGFALKMYYLQSDSAEIDLEYTKRFYQKQMPPKEFYRSRLFAFEVSKDDKNPLYFRYNIFNKQFTFKVREAIH